MPLKKLEDMTLQELRRQYARQVHIYHYRKHRHEDTEQALTALDELGNRIVKLGGKLPKVPSSS